MQSLGLAGGFRCEDGPADSSRPGHAAQADSVQTYQGIQSQKDFETFRARLLADPERNVPWQNYLFDQNVPWIGVPDDEIRKATECGVAPIISMAYTPQYYPRSLLKSYGDFIQAPGSRR